MDEDLIDDATLSLDRKSRLPGTGFFYPDSLDDERVDERAASAVAGADVVVVTDSDADGLACVALVREAYDAVVDPAPFEAYRDARIDDDRTTDELDTAALAADADNVTVDDDGGLLADSTVALLPAGPHSLREQLGRAAEHAEPGVDVFVCDICPDDAGSVEPALSNLVERASSVAWYDHHQWDDETAAAIREHGIELVVGDSDEECSADVTLRSLDHEFPERFETLAAVTRDHDLWLKEDERSDDLADYSFWSSPAEYAAVVGAYGVDLPEPIRGYVDARREEKEALIDAAVRRAETHEIGPWTVGVTYGRCSQNEVAETLRERGADAAVIVKPAGSASIRGSETFERAHEVAGQVNGGGHPKAAGCKPDIYDDMLDVARHWTTEGEAAKRVILAAFERVADDIEADGTETAATADD
ncbi:DHH family phosphoesterase [Halobaculum sp. MBLA0143]|uniref:DHH family phosphoesterase n=1 Tax=Halobaculum sp. MBLA0143 TaxID=3079933 RepID=UPI0035239D8E